MSKLFGVEAARGIAALLVVMVHATNILVGPKFFDTPALGGLFRFGHAGVDFFFVLSGFIIYYIHHGELGHPEYLGAYWAKRFVRIYPVYWIVLAAFGLLLAMSPTKEMWERVPAVIAASILLIPHEKGGIVSVAWTLSHELLFYALFSVLFLSRRWGRMLLALWLAAIGVQVATGYFNEPLFVQFVLRIFNLHFFVGMGVAWWVLRSRRGAATPLGRWSLFGGPMVFLGSGVADSLWLHLPAEWPPLHVVYALSAGLALYGLVAEEQAGRLAPPAWLVRVGSASYSLYLIHTLVIMVFAELLWRMNGVVPVLALGVHAIFVASVAVSVWVAVVFSERVELPLLRRLRPKSVERANVGADVGAGRPTGRS